MIKYILIFALLIAAVYSFTIEQDEDLLSEDAEEEVVPEEARFMLRVGAVCDGNKSDCQCLGKWIKCGCPFLWPMRSGPCHCTKGRRYTYNKKLSCSNRYLWASEKSR
uniref:Toxin 27 n=1 Tax=Cupiennius salei TaxID=6928 RepID=A0A4Y5UGQ5_CUPSA|nr:toxin 27 precursor [Cupiennius salei]